MRTWTPTAYLILKIFQQHSWKHCGLRINLLEETRKANTSALFQIPQIAICTFILFYLQFYNHSDYVQKIWGKKELWLCFTKFENSKKIRHIFCLNKIPQSCVCVPIYRSLIQPYNSSFLCLCLKWQKRTDKELNDPFLLHSL